MSSPEYLSPQGKKLAQLERENEQKEANVLQEEPLFLLHQLVQYDESVALDDISRKIDSISTKKRPSYKWWVGIGILMQADMVHILGDRILPTEQGRDFYREFENHLKDIDRLDNESPMPTP